MRVAKLHKDAFIPTRKHKGDAGFDLYSMENRSIAPGYSDILYTGITIEIPKNIVGIIYPKSGTDALILGGVVDNIYQGQILVHIYNTGREFPYRIKKGDQIAQIVFLNLAGGDNWDLEEVSKDEIHKVKTLRADAGGIKTAKFTSEAKLINDMGRYGWD